MARPHLAALVLLVALLPLRLAHAAEPLESDQISRWLASMSDLRTWSEANEDRLDRDMFEPASPRMSPMSPPSEEDIERMRSPFTNGVAAARTAGVEREVLGIVEPHGFSLDEWGETGDRIMRAYIALQMEGQPDMTSKLDETIQQMENSPMSQTQKNQMINSLMRPLDIYNMMKDAPAEDVEAVRPMAGTIRQTFEN